MYARRNVLDVLCLNHILNFIEHATLHTSNISAALRTILQTLTYTPRLGLFCCQINIPTFKIKTFLHGLTS